MMSVTKFALLAVVIVGLSAVELLMDQVFGTVYRGYVEEFATKVFLMLGGVIILTVSREQI